MNSTLTFSTPHSLILGQILIANTPHSQTLNTRHILIVTTRRITIMIASTPHITTANTLHILLVNTPHTQIHDTPRIRKKIRFTPLLLLPLSLTLGLTVHTRLKDRPITIPGV